MKHNLTPLAFAALAFLGGQAHAASTLQPNADGTAYDTATGLTWKRCMEGQTWDGTTCTGKVAIYTSAQAYTFTGNGWRLPNIRELLSIVDETVSSPALDKTIFPNNSGPGVWSDSPSYAYNTSFAWGVDFKDGSTNNYHYNINGSFYGTLLVRGGQSFATLLNPARPSSDYIDNGDGTVTHKPTQLMWQRCMVGQTWNGSTCTGFASAMTWDKAKTTTSSVAGKTDWRLPTKKELESLVDYTKATSPTLNSTMFPNDSGYSVWSGSPYANDASLAWSVGFRYTYSFYQNRSSNNVVRLVRNALSSATAPTTLSDTDCFLDWAEARIPSLLTPHQTTQTAGTISYRGAYSSGIYLGVQGDSVLALGGQFGNNVTTLGTLSSFAPTARAAGCK